jgi:LuxR family maltose regulon positive regulatory protein
MVELLSTKLFIPRPRSDRVSRPRLIERLNAGLDRKITMIAAPAGFGKTTLLSEWIPRCPRPVAWFSLDEGDNSPARFWAYVIAALQTLSPELGKSAQPLLSSLPTPPIKSILTSLLNEIHAFEQPFVFIFDDYHLIENTEVDDELAYLIDHQPPNLHLLITTRIDPGLPLSRLRARNQLVELRANDLRFTADEAGMFLTQVMGLNLSAEEVATLDARTEGWIAGLQIAALSMQGHADMAGFIKTFSGSHRHILGYLADEVLNLRPKDTLDFLLQTSILDRLCGPLCDTVTGESNGKMMLESLERANLFITPLDHEGMWYRYHHLFAEVLRTHLQRAEPNRVQDLHRAASTWYEQNGMLSEAVSHALAAQDFNQASHLIEQTSRAMWQRGEVKSLQNWLAALPPGIRRARPQLSLAQAWCALAVGQFAVADASILEAEETIGALSDGEARSLRAQADAIRSSLAGYRQDTASAIELARNSLEHLPETDQFLRGLLFYNLGRAYLSRGDLPAASQKLREAATLSLNAGDLPTASFALGALGAELEVQGQLRQAASCYRQVIQAAQMDGRPLSFTASGACIRLGGILYEWNRLEEAQQYTNQGIELSRSFQDSGVMLIGCLVLVRVLKAHDDIAGAIGLLQNAENAVHSGMLPGASLRMVEAVRARLWLAQKNIEDAAQWAARYESELKFPAGSDWPAVRQLSSLYDYECLTLVRVRMAQAQWNEALRLLGRLQPLVETGARQAGLIELLILRAVALQMLGNRAKSIAALEHALTLTAPEDFMRSFLDEGEPLRLLLAELQAILRKRNGRANGSFSSVLLAYTEKLLAAFPRLTPSGVPSTGRIVEALSDRERAILQLIATGHSNKEIAEILVVAVSTVKSHINNLYGKIGATRRTQAIVIARDSGLLSE